MTWVHYAKPQVCNVTQGATEDIELPLVCGQRITVHENSDLASKKSCWGPGRSGGRARGGVPEGLKLSPSPSAESVGSLQPGLLPLVLRAVGGGSH